MFSRVAGITRVEFNARWGLVLDDMTKKQGCPSPSIVLDHTCTENCCSTAFVSQRFPHTAICTFSGKMHVCLIGGSCPKTILTSEGDIVCMMTHYVIAQDNLLPNYEQTTQSDFRYGAECMGGIDATVMTHTSAGKAHTGHKLDTFLDSEGVASEMAALVREVTRSSVTCATQRLARGGATSRGHIRSSNGSASSQGRTALTPEEVVVHTIEEILESTSDPNHPNCLAEADLAVLSEKVPPVLIRLFQRAGNSCPQSTSFLPAFVYAFLDTLGRRGIPGVQEGPMPRLSGAMMPQNEIHKISIDSSNISKAERALKGLLDRDRKV